MKKIIISFFIIVNINFILLNISNATSLKNDMVERSPYKKVDVSETEHYITYETKASSIKLPHTFNKISETSYMKDAGETFYIEADTYDINDNATEDDVYNSELLEYFKNNFESGFQSEIRNFSISNYIDKEITKNLDQETLENLETDIKNNCNYSINVCEFCNCTKNNYKAVHIRGNVNYYDTYNIIIDEYIIITQNYITTITTTSANIDYFDSDEFYSILNNITINDEVLPISASNSFFPTELIVGIICISCYIFVMRLIYIKYRKRGVKALPAFVLVFCLNFIGIIIIELAADILTDKEEAEKYNKYHNKNYIEETDEETDEFIRKLKGKNNESTISSKVKDNVECKVCGKEIPYNDKNICRECEDKLLKKIEEKEKRFCTKCGKEIKNEWEYCNYCGNKLK